MLEHLVLRGAARRAALPPCGGTLGSVLMITGSLGAGGAERQLVNTAVGLQRARLGGQAVAGHRLGGPVGVCCRSLTDRPGGAFFEPLLRREGIPLGLYAGFPAFGGEPETSVARQCRDLLRFLPPAAADATIRLADALRAQAPAVHRQVGRAGLSDQL